MSDTKTAAKPQATARDFHAASTGLPVMYQRPSRILWQDLQKWIHDEAETRRTLIHEASVVYPEVIGNIRDLHPINSVNHFFTIERVRAALDLLKEDTVPGPDGMTVAEFRAQPNLDEILETLAWQVRNGLYQPGPTLRVHIPKADGSFRPLGIPNVVDRVVQKTWRLIIGRLFERAYLPCSFGYRVGRNCHQAIQEIAREISSRGNIWVIDADISKFFDSVPHHLLLSILKRYCSDKRFLQFCKRTLKALIVHADGKVEQPERGTPQGGVISPEFANLYLHWVLDVFFEEVIRPQLRGWSRLFRYADDFVVLAESQEDADLARKLIDARLSEWGLLLHPEKTSIRTMCSPALHPLHTDESDRELLFLGFQLRWLKKASGRWELVGRTAPGRFERALEGWRRDLAEMTRGIRSNKRKPVASRQNPGAIARKLWTTIDNHIRGYGQYYGVEGNGWELRRYEEAIIRDAAEFWRRHVDDRGANPFVESKDRIWTEIRMRPLHNLTGTVPVHNITPEKEEGGADE